MNTIPLKNPVLAAVGLAFALAQSASAQDFNLSIQPDELTLIPNQSASFVVTLAPFNGFNSNVTLSVETLPSGVTAQFSPSSLTPPGTSILTLDAATNAQLGSFELNVVATGGGITNTTSSSVTVNFGLLPVCYGAIKGRVTDIQTGQPVAGVPVQAQAGIYSLGGTSDTNGMYLITGLPLDSPDNQPLSYSLVANTAAGYWQSLRVSAYAVCDATNVADLQMLRQQTGSISGQVLGQGDTPLAGAQVSLQTWTVWGPETVTSTNADTRGSFQFQDVQLGWSNSPTSYILQASYAGYWPYNTNATAQAGSNTVVTMPLVQVCSNNVVTGRVTLCDKTNNGPIPSITVVVTSTYNWVQVLSDSNGYFIVSNLILNPGNTPVNANVVAENLAGYYNEQAQTRLGACGDSNYVTLCMKPVPPPPPPPPNNYGGLTGHVYDAQTGKPIAGVNVGASDQWVGVTDTNGTYLNTNIFIGTGETTNAALNPCCASANGYWQDCSYVKVYANEVVTQDFHVLRIGYGYVEGTVRDAATKLPIPSAYIQGLDVPADANGHYFSGPLQLDSGNAPTRFNLSAEASGYWTASTNTTVTLGVTNAVDIELVKVCTGATILGNVVDALTQRPITNATVTDSGYNSHWTTTDTNGNFILTNITVGNYNSPIQTTLTASAPGYISQNKSITIFCGATIITEFGVPQTVFGAIDGYVTNAISGVPLTNAFIGTGFGAATSTDTNGYYSLSQVPLGLNGASMTWSVTAMPDGYPAQTKSVAVFSNQVSRLDFGFGQPPAALIVTASGTPDPVGVGSNLLYTVTLTNTAADAANVQLVDTLPSNVTFLSASVTNPGGGDFSAPVFDNGAVTTAATNFTSNSLAVLWVSVRPTTPGSLTNVAAVTSDTPDMDPTASNHTAMVITTVTASGNPPPVTNVSVQVLGPVVFNRQTGLFEQPIQLNNLSATPLSGVRISLAGLPADVVLYNESGSSDGAPFLEYDQTVAVGASVGFVLEYYRSNRLAFVSTNFTAVAVAALSPSTPTGTTLQLDRNPFLSNGQLVIEFASTPGATYLVQYSADLLTWKTAVPPIVAAGTRVLWIDSGPPKTDSPPGPPVKRFYRVLQTH